MPDETFMSLVTFDREGLVPAVVQDDASGEVLMVAYMNAEALERTVETGRSHFWSRSRGRLWQKGETSGHVQEVKSIWTDCDGDCLLLRVAQTVAACHTGYRSCFHRRRTASGGVQTHGEPIFDPEERYG